MSALVPVCVLNDTRVDLHHGCESVMSAMESLLRANGCEILALSPAHSDWSSDAPFLRALERARLVVVNGEGTIHHDRPAGRKLLEVGAWAANKGIPAVLINASWEANSPELAALVDRFALVTVRDSASSAELAAHGRVARVVPDLSLYGVPPDAHPVQRRGMEFTDSVDRSAALALEGARAACDGGTLSIMFAQPGIGAGLRFVRGAVGRDDLRSPQHLVKLLLMKQRMLRNATPSTTEFLRRLRSAALVVSGRLHACTLAYVTGTPFVACPTESGKLNAFIADSGLESWRAEHSLEPRALREAMARGWSRAEDEARAAFLARAQTAADELFREIRGLAA